MQKCGNLEQQYAECCCGTFPDVAKEFALHFCDQSADDEKTSQLLQELRAAGEAVPPHLRTPIAGARLPITESRELDRLLSFFGSNRIAPDDLAYVFFWCLASNPIMILPQSDVRI
jgi:hypothetical protein